ncbi:hypothetical protein K2173_026264 [Erythroxylum novogranatense]|uniref:Bet v I/Major latex protein domain-containing protein n=1 Tax=Erythroxylum novogranatense TaxID=1862640 RepID=A0AAV8SC43_9ROSI|nr:hypothetical protein K2173_026264 [Erythroxylum novogranatense]
MGVTTTQEYNSCIPAPRLFKAVVLESEKVLPKAMPEAFKCIEVEGDVRVTKLPEGGEFKYMKHRTDVLDINNYFCKYTLFEGDILGDKLESVVHEVKYEASGKGCVVKATNHYHPKTGVVLNLEEINAGEVKALGLYKAVEEYLLANPTVCA